jgi:LCP family protein required for cell wall assembly
VRSTVHRRRSSSRAGSGRVGRRSTWRARYDADETYWTKGDSRRGFIRRFGGAFATLWAWLWSAVAFLPRLVAHVLGRILRALRKTSLAPRRPGVRIAVLIALPLLIVGGLSAGSLAGWLQATLGSLQANDPVTVRAVRRHLVAARPGEPVNILLLGSDRHQPRGPGEVDSILLARLDPAAHSVALLTIPRDLRTWIPGRGSDAVASAYSLGGALLTLETIKALTGLRINHFLDLNYQAFIDVVDTLGGVHYAVPAGLPPAPGPSWASAPLEPGYHLLDGRQLLSYMRIEEDAYGGEGWLAGQGTVLAELRRGLAASVDWTDPLGTLRLLQRATRNTVSDIAGVPSWYYIARMLTESEAGRFRQVQLTGRTVTSGDVTSVIASPAEIAQAVRTFLAPPAGT